MFSVLAFLVGCGAGGNGDELDGNTLEGLSEKCTEYDELRVSMGHTGGVAFLYGGGERAEIMSPDGWTLFGFGTGVAPSEDEPATITSISADTSCIQNATLVDGFVTYDVIEGTDIGDPIAGTFELTLMVEGNVGDPDQYWTARGTFDTKLVELDD